jgi:hypothetical protein
MAARKSTTKTATQKQETAKQEEPIIESKFTQEEITQLDSILKMVKMDKQDMDLIFELYKRFINPNLKIYNVGCKCHNNITHLQQKLIEYYVNNR